MVNFNKPGMTLKCTPQSPYLYKKKKKKLLPTSTNGLRKYSEMKKKIPDEMQVGF